MKNYLLELRWQTKWTMHIDWHISYCSKSNPDTLKNNRVFETIQKLWNQTLNQGLYISIDINITFKNLLLGYSIGINITF